MDSVNQLRSEGGPAPLLAMAGLVKRFTGTLALDHVDFDVHRGEVHALLGQNGAGKSTLIKILAGVYQADAGDILFAGKPAHPETDALPIAFIHQDLGLVEWMTIAENVAIQTGYPRSRTGLISWPRVRDAAAEALAIMGSELDPETPVSSLPAAERSLVAIGRALAIKSDILVLDEPTAALPEADVERLLETLRRLRASNIGIVYVTHRLDEVMRIADRVTVLRDGRRLATVAARETNAGELVQMIVGRSMSDAFVRPAQPSDRGRAVGRGSRRPTRRPGVILGRGRRNPGARGLARRRASHHRTGDLRPHGDGFRSTDARRRADCASEPGRSDGQGRRVRIEPPGRGGPRLEPRRARKHLFESGGERQRRTGIRFARNRTRRSPGGGAALFHQDGGGGGAGRDAVRRQSAEGGARALDGGARQAPHSRGADDRRRRRRQGGHLPSAAAFAAARDWRCC